MLIAQTFVLALLTPFAVVSARQGSTFNVSASEAAKYGCGAKCYSNLKLTSAADLSIMGTDFDFSFYKTAKSFCGSKPGDILKVEVLDPSSLDIDSGLTVYRIQYTSKDFNGRVVPATGFVAFPQAPPTWSPNKYPLVAYAHGTIGLYRGCAPSAGPGLFDYKSWSLITERGYAIVATDYAGLGNNYTYHKYCTYPAHANDVYYSVVAAKKAFHHKLSNEWVSVGHSQGGSTVWKLAEQVKELRSSKGSASSGRYLGTVSLSPGPKIRDIVYWSVNNVLPKPNYHDYVVTAELPYVALALKRFDPSFNISRIVAPALQRRLELAEKMQACTSVMMGLTLDLPKEDLFSPDLLSDAKHHVRDNEITKWQDLSAPVSGGVATEPLMVVQGLGDTSVVPEKTIEAYREACKNKDYEVHLRLYSIQDHSATVVSSSAEWLDWIQDRFAGKRSVGHCTSIIRKPFDAKHTKVDVELDTSSFYLSYN